MGVSEEFMRLFDNLHKSGNPETEICLKVLKFVELPKDYAKDWLGVI
jgi:hypothetical protein